MGRKLTGGVIENVPTIGITRKEKGFFVGILQGPGKDVKRKVGQGTNHIWPFTILETNCSVQIQGADKKYAEVNVNLNDKVVIFAPTVLDNALKTAKVGEKVRIDYLGKKPGPNGAYHSFDIEVL